MNSVDVEVGNYVMVYTDFTMEKINPKATRETLDIFDVKGLIHTATYGVYGKCYYISRVFIKDEISWRIPQ